MARKCLKNTGPHGNMRRKTGWKSTIISQDAGEFALNNPNKTIMVIAAVERSALLLSRSSRLYL